MPISNPAVTVLLSGGLDSSALIHYYMSRSNRVLAVHFDYGQPAQVSEAAAAQRIASYFGVSLSFIRLGFDLGSSNGEFFCRNALFLLAALARGGDEVRRVAIGVHSGVSYYDSTIHFIDDLQRLVDGYFAGRVSIEAPFLLSTKSDIIAYCNTHRVPHELTYSCERQNDNPCGLCPSCRDRGRML